ncbi:MAG: pilus assembly protein N-terminal domain-containing protein [Archangium sp.]|nr:pilus assembly protein N-terminal domain-containing protein [Archangium sp.]
MFVFAVTLWVTLAAPDGGTAFTSPAKLLEEAKRWKRAGDYDRALGLMQTCLELDPKNLDCLIATASSLAMRGTEENSDADQYQARVAYQRFLELAPPEDKRAPRVKAILDAVSEPPAVGPLRIPPPPRGRENRPFIPPSDVVVMPARVTVPLKGSKTVPVSTIVRLENDDPATVDASLSDAATLRLTGRKRGVANLKLYDRDQSWHAMRVEVP